jgi:hypothetical protein
MPKGSDTSGHRGPMARALIGALALGLLITLFGGCTRLADESRFEAILNADTVGFDEPLFTFAVLADTHIPDGRWRTPDDDFRYIKALSVADTILVTCVDDINAHTPPVDFTIILGDISDTGTPYELNRAAEILSSLDAPYYPVVGNHDNFQDDNKQAWKDAFGYDSTHYVFTVEGFKFLVIDPTLDPYDPPDRVACYDEGIRNWVTSELDRDPDMPAFLINHYPLLNRCWNAKFEVFPRMGDDCLGAEADTMSEAGVRLPRGYPSQAGVPFNRVQDGGRELRDSLETHGNVIASLSGHVHANRSEVYNGITYVDIGATLVGRPSIRYFYVYPGRVEADFEYISDTALIAHVEGMCTYCTECTYPNAVCDFIDGRLDDKRFTIFVPQRITLESR